MTLTNNIALHIWKLLRFDLQSSHHKKEIVTMWSEGCWAECILVTISQYIHTLISLCCMPYSMSIIPQLKMVKQEWIWRRERQRTPSSFGELWWWAVDGTFDSFSCLFWCSLGNSDPTVKSISFDPFPNYTKNNFLNWKKVYYFT